jgi:hypothetical protein
MHKPRNGENPPRNGVFEKQRMEHERNTTHTGCRNPTGDKKSEVFFSVS